MTDPDLNRARLDLVLALAQAGLTGDETFGDLLDAIDVYVDMVVAVALHQDTQSDDGL